MRARVAGQWARRMGPPCGKARTRWSEGALKQRPARGMASGTIVCAVHVREKATAQLSTVGGEPEPPLFVALRHLRLRRGVGAGYARGGHRVGAGGWTPGGRRRVDAGGWTREVGAGWAQGGRSAVWSGEAQRWRRERSPEEPPRRYLLVPLCRFLAILRGPPELGPSVF